MADKQWFWNSTTRTAGVALAATGFSALVGYREADGVDPEDLMPKLGPVPAEAIFGIIAGGVALSGIAGDGKVGNLVAGAADGAAAVFCVSGGQSLGHKLHEVFKGTGGLLPGTGAKRERAQLNEPAPKAEIRDAHGRHMEVRRREVQPAQEL
jgi:hypothetical protein